jgi:hypothetical protein
MEAENQRIALHRVVGFGDIEAVRHFLPVDGNGKMNLVSTLLSRIGKAPGEDLLHRPDARARIVPDILEKPLSLRIAVGLEKPFDFGIQGRGGKGWGALHPEGKCRQKPKEKKEKKIEEPHRFHGYTLTLSPESCPED